MTYLSQNSELMSFLRSTSIAVVATVSKDGQAMAATVYFVVDDKFNFYFTTKAFTRKNENLHHNKNVALVVGTENEPVTAQIQGVAEQVVDETRVQWIMGEMKKIFKGNTYVAPLFQVSPDQNNNVVFYKITPNWIRWLDLRGDKVDGDFVQILPAAK